jgi:hypothetical protein
MEWRNWVVWLARCDTGVVDGGGAAAQQLTSSDLLVHEYRMGVGDCQTKELGCVVDSTMSLQFEIDMLCCQCGVMPEFCSVWRCCCVRASAP